MLLNVFEALHTKQPFFPASMFWVHFIHHIDEWAGKNSLLETEFGACPKPLFISMCQQHELHVLPLCLQL